MSINHGRAFSDLHEAHDSAEASYVYEHGWQSWSPAGAYPADLPHSPRPQKPIWQAMAFRPEAPAPARGFQGEGLLAIVNSDGSAEVFFSPEPDVAVASIRARDERGRIVVSSDGPVEHLRAATLDTGLAAVGDRLAARLLTRDLVALPAGWCSWYAYWDSVAAADIVANLEVIDRADLGMEVVQVDDGYQSGIGDWLDDRPGFGSLDEVAQRIIDTGRTPGLWTAPFLAGVDSDLARRHPDWLVQGAVAADNHWGQQIRVLDVTHPEAAEHLVALFARLRERGFVFHKIDFIYGGAIVGRRHEDVTAVAAYRRGLELIRQGAGEDAIILGCGAPLLPSIGLVDAMRISPDVMPAWEPDLHDVSQPAMRSALAGGRARAWMHGRLWVNDPDCVLVRAEVERPEPWADYVGTLRGLAVSSDPLPQLTSGELERTRELMAPADLGAVAWDPWAGPDQGLIHRT
ncbi:MAG: glycoside hydrolase family 36 protein [Candidatus Nanopelagicales bacterium]